MAETWTVTLLLDNADPLELSREVSSQAAIARARAEIEEGRLGPILSYLTIRPGHLRLVFSSGCVECVRGDAEENA